jgi:hypothetical protein
MLLDLIRDYLKTSNLGYYEAEIVDTKKVFNKRLGNCLYYSADSSF